MTMHLENPGLTTNRTTKRKPSKKAQQAQKKHDDWLRSQGLHKDQIAEREEKRKKVEAKKKKAQPAKKSHVGFADADKSSMAGVAAKREPQVYNGERKLIGVATMHKSNMVPVFEDRKEDAKDIANMRRG